MDEVSKQFDRYMLHAFGSVNGTEVVDDRGGREVDERFLRHVEALSGVMGHARDEFRQQCCLIVALRGMDLTLLPMLAAGLRRKAALVTACKNLKVNSPPAPTVGVPLDLSQFKAELAEGLDDVKTAFFTGEGGYELRN